MAVQLGSVKKSQHLILFSCVPNLHIPSFDLEFPLEVDDPYWGDEHGWKQPEDVPCTVSFFTHFIKLTQVIAFTSRTIVSSLLSFHLSQISCLPFSQYAINKTRLFTGLIKGDWRNEVLTQLNSALEECIEGIPTHCKRRFIFLCGAKLIASTASQ